MRINKLWIVISAILAVVLGIISYATYTTPGVYEAFMLLTQLAALSFMTLYITYTSPDKSFR